MGLFRVIFQNLIFIPGVVLCTVICSVLVVIVRIFSKKIRILKKIEYLWAKSICFASGIDLVVDSVPLDTKKCYVFISNHMSHLDTPIIMSILKDFSPRFIAKDSLFKIPIFGQGMRAAGHLSLHKKEPLKAMKELNKAIETLKQGESVLLFPEGTRNTYEDKLLDFKIGAFIIAIKMGLEMVPIVIYGTGKCLPKGSIFVRPGKVYVKIFDPVPWALQYNLKRREELKELTYDFMQKKFLELKEWVSKETK